MRENITREKAKKNGESKKLIKTLGRQAAYSRVIKKNAALC